MRFSASSDANAFVRLRIPPFQAPPIAAPLPGLKAAVPEVRVSEPPFPTISCFARAVAVSTSNLFVHDTRTFARNDTSPELDTEKVFRIVEVGYCQRPTDDFVDSREDDVV
jgi:hypothetical protein